MSRFIEEFLNTRKPIVTRTFNVNADDWKYLSRVCPEHGFRTNFPGYCVKKLVELLKQENITNINERLRHPNFARIPRLLSHFDVIAGAESEEHER